MFFCFFFQAEDGIRYLTVTGVQTCALPIFVGAATVAGALLGPRKRFPLAFALVAILLAYAVTMIVQPRSEEHTSELQSQSNLVCRLLLEKKNLKRRIDGNCILQLST